jgi:hypothetical protein
MAAAGNPEIVNGTFVIEEDDDWVMLFIVSKAAVPVPITG